MLFHLSVDMQRLFGPGSPWAVPWTERILGGVARLAAHHPERTIFTRFIPPQSPADAVGAWREYYSKWREVTGEMLGAHWLGLFPELEKFVPPARVVDKVVYSPWSDGKLAKMLQGSGATRLLISGGESDVCVMATVLGAIDHGYHVVLATDALCSTMDETHDAAMKIYRLRFSAQVTLTTVDEALEKGLSEL
ncbi:cysteine hydrolase [Cypionkella sp.]|uniref:cysteine hydrolase family protein n=1 Tax=Cypionkella sp. TaxID=2811411 RepID=UPI002604839F|nr:cysteine hydrolase [Cypionkella sp.]